MMQAMIIGNPEIFAIEYDIKEISVDRDTGTEWSYGPFRLHFEHYSVGNAEKWIHFGICLFAMENWLRKIDLPTQQYSDMSSVELMKIYKTKSTVDLLAFNGNAKAAADWHVQSMSREDFCEGMDLYSSASVNIEDGPFDDVSILMVDAPPDSKRFIIQQRKDGVKEFIVQTDIIVDTVQSFFRSFESEKQNVPVKYFSNNIKTTIDH